MSGIYNSIYLVRSFFPIINFRFLKYYLYELTLQLLKILKKYYLLEIIISIVVKYD